MELIKLLRAILSDVLIGNFDVVNFDKSDSRFDIYLDETRLNAEFVSLLKTYSYTFQKKEEKTFQNRGK